MGVSLIPMDEQRGRREMLRIPWMWSDGREGVTCRAVLLLFAVGPWFAGKIAQGEL